MSSSARICSVKPGIKKTKSSGAASKVLYCTVNVSDAENFGWSLLGHFKIARKVLQILLFCFVLLVIMGGAMV